MPDQTPPEHDPKPEVTEQEPFSLVPRNRADEQDLEDRGIEWIKDKLRESANYIPNVHVIKRLLEKNNEYSDEEFFALLAYRCLKDLVTENFQRVQAAQQAEQAIQVPNREIIIPGRETNGT